MKWAPVYFTHLICFGIQFDAQSLAAISDGHAAPFPGHYHIRSVDRHHPKEPAPVRFWGILVQR